MFTYKIKNFETRQCEVVNFSQQTYLMLTVCLHTYIIFDKKNIVFKFIKSLNVISKKIHLT